MIDSATLTYALNTFFLLITGSLVLWMGTGFVMLEAGLVRSKNTTDVLMKNLVLYAIACVMFSLIGYRIMYGKNDGGLVPLSFGQDHGGAYSSDAHFFFNLVFAETGLAILSGAVTERMRLKSFALFSVVYAGVIYPLTAFWVWGGGFLAILGGHDLCGAGVVHFAGAVAALAAVVQLGPRAGKYTGDGRINPMPGANLPLAALGCFILWFGWMGFNGGAQLVLVGREATDTVARILVNTNASACAGTLAAFLFTIRRFGKADLTMVINGALAGLVVISAEPGAPTLWQASFYGALAGLLVNIAITSLEHWQIDDPVGAISVHGVSGALGLLLVPLARPEVSFFAQLQMVLVIGLWSFGASWLVLKMLSWGSGLRLDAEAEYDGLDISQYGMEAYPEFTGARVGVHRVAGSGEHRGMIVSSAFRARRSKAYSGKPE